MKELIGVHNFASVPLSTKQLLLIFDRIALPLYSKLGDNCERLFRFSEEPRQDHLIEIDFLYNQGILFDPFEDFDLKSLKPSNNTQYNNYIRNLVKEFNNSANSLFDAQKKYNDFLDTPVPDNESEKSKLVKQLCELENNNWEALLYYGSLMATLESCLLNSEMNINSVPIYNGTNFIQNYGSGLKQDTLNIILNNFPIPDENTSIEDILEFRKDSDSKIKFTRLRHWMKSVATKELKQKDIEDELDCLLFEYQQHMEFFKIKTKRGHLETLITATAELLEDIVKVKWGKVAKNIFSLRHKKIALLEAELNAPGKEVAYIAKLNTYFGKRI